MTFRDCLAEQCKLHPSMQCVDVVKLCHQADFGAEHLLTDVASAKAYFEKEYDGSSCSDTTNIPLVEYISSDVARVNFVPWITAGNDEASSGFWTKLDDSITKGISIEVKSNNYVSHSSLDKFRDKFSSKIGNSY